jgi:hypothetical protein
LGDQCHLRLLEAEELHLQEEVPHLHQEEEELLVAEDLALVTHLLHLLSLQVEGCLQAVYILQVWLRLVGLLLSLRQCSHKLMHPHRQRLQGETNNLLLNN